MIPAAGTTLADGRYRLERRLGAGGMASVWLAVDERLGRHVAVKVVADTLADDEQWLRRFEREARAAASVTAPGVVSVLDYGVEDGRPFLVMEYVRGGSLAERLADPTARRPPPEAVTRELLEALERVHAAGIIHRDVKPANVLLDERDHIRLTDFGIAQLEDATALTQTGMLVGTVRYLAPEILAGEPATARSDLYSAGIVIGEIARNRETPALSRLIHALAAPSAADRPASAADAVRLLDAAQGAGSSGGDGATALTRRMLLRAPGRPGPETVARTRVARPSSPASRPRAGVVEPPEGSRAAAADEPARGPRLSAGALLAALAAAAVLVAFVVVLASAGGGASGAGGRPPGPAPAGASISRQLDGLQQIVDYARSH